MMELCTIHVLYFSCSDLNSFDTGCSRLFLIYIIIEIISLSSQASNHTIQPFSLQFSDEEHLEDLKQGKPSTLKFRSPEEWKLRKLLASDVVTVMYTDSMWRGSVTFLLKEGACYTAIDVMFTSLLTYHNLTLTLPSNLSHSNYKFPWSFSLVFYFFWLLIHQSSEMTEDIGLGGSWFVFWEQDTPNSWRVMSFLETPVFFGEGAVISRLE